MDVAAVKEYCSCYPGTSSKLFGPPSNILVYYVGGRKFAYFKTSEPEQWRFSICTSPERFLELTDVPGIKPARYMAKFRWVTIVDVETVPAEYLQELITWSYAKALSSLSKRQQAAIALEQSQP
ncbi:MmcQ/YjbR family DNA-binding protein [Pseudomonas sp. F(2018)]|uniref:MmcQ/YjbR family DNA-binding protein n=1 Tax=Pseudomonas sp. F(2018) TaxID=2502240 RepID=UPI0010F58A03|nr:MmcQ/YjbR family DNA-binding protein [Pseudomonas sp. F(2018)]